MYPGSIGTNSHRWSQNSLKDRHSPCLGPAANSKKLLWNRCPQNVNPGTCVYHPLKFPGELWKMLGMSRWTPENRGFRDDLWCLVPMKKSRFPYPCLLTSFIGTRVAGSLMAPNHTTPGAPSLMSTPKHLGGSTSRRVAETQALPSAVQMLEPLICAA